MRSKLLWSLVGAATAITAYVHREPDTDPGVGALQEAADAAIAQTDPDDILIDLKDNATPDIVAQIESDLSIKLHLVSDQSADEQFYRASVDPSRRDLVLAALEKRPEVEIAEPDAMYSLLPGEAMTVTREDVMQPGFPNDPLYKKQWHMRQIGMPEAWKLADGNGITVAVLDTGVAYEDFENFKLLEDLKGIEFVDGWDFVGNDEHANDDHAHGSHVTGTIAQVTNNGIGVTGVARNVKIMPLKVLSGSGSGSVAGIADAIRYAADKGAKVMNMSLGGAFPSRILKKAVEYAHAQGVTVICAAGNESRNKVGYPAAYPGAVAVSATQTDEDITFYSNTGKDIDIAGPGGNTRDSSGGRNNPDGGVLQNTIATNQPGKAEYAAYMGTSMASPHVAGVAALVVGEGVTKPNRVEEILKATARKPANGKKFTAERYGAGIVDAPAAVLAAKKDAGGNGWQLMLGLLMAGAVAASARARGLAVKLGPSYLGGVVLGASGLFFLPSLAPSIASLPVIETLTRGLPSWDLSLLGPLGHGNALFFSALIPLAGLAIGYGVPKARAPLAGLSIGVAAHLAFFAVAPMMTLHYVPGVFGLASMWLALNAVACVLLARLALRR